MLIDWGETTVTNSMELELMEKWKPGSRHRSSYVAQRGTIEPTGTSDANSKDRNRIIGIPSEPSMAAVLWSSGAL